MSDFDDMEDLVNDHHAEIASLRRNLIAMSKLVDGLIEWKASMSAPIIIEFGNAFADDSPRSRQRQAAELLRAEPVTK